MSYKIVKENTDPLALRLSIGSPTLPGARIDRDGYIVYRGDLQDCVKLLRQALRELEAHARDEGFSYA